MNLNYRSLDFLKVVRLVFAWFRSLALRAHSRATRSKARLVSKSNRSRSSSLKRKGKERGEESKQVNGGRNSVRFLNLPTLLSYSHDTLRGECAHFSALAITCKRVSCVCTEETNFSNIGLTQLCQGYCSYYLLITNQLFIREIHCSFFK